MGRSALVIAFTNLRDDPRVQRQLECLGGDFELTAIGAASPEVRGVRFLLCPGVRTELPRDPVACVKRIARRYESAYWKVPQVRYCRALLSSEKFDVIVANDILTLPLSLRLAHGARVVFDAHEYSPRQHESSMRWRVLDQGLNTYLCRTYLPMVDGMITVCDGIAEAYAENFGVVPRVMTNAPSHRNLAPRMNATESIRMIHHGAAIPGRRLENIIEMMRHLDARFTLDIILVPGDPRYIKRLHALARGLSSVRFLPRVPMRELPEFVNAYDVGVPVIGPTSFNYYQSLPNKFFEYIQGRLALAIGPSPEMVRIVREHGCGVVASAFTPRALAEAVMQLDAAKIGEMKANSDRAARVHCAENNFHVLREVVGADTAPWLESGAQAALSQ